MTSWITPKTDWAYTDGITEADLNRIEGNILVVAGATYAGTPSLESLYSDHGDHVDDVGDPVDDDNIHDSTLVTRTATGIRLSLEITNSDSGHSDGDIWILDSS